MKRSARLLFVFLDGVGIGEEDPERNPLMRAPVPTLRGLLGEQLPTLRAPHVEGRTAVAFPLDALLGVEGTPQSGTGQATLLTGTNAAALYGRHFGPWTPVALRPLVEEESIFARAVAAGLGATFANAYPRGWPGPRGGRRVAGPPLAARAAGLLDRHEEALGDGRAVSSEIVNHGWRNHLGFDWLPEISEEAAGRNLATIAGESILTMYAHYATDTVGHRGGMDGAIQALERVDRFLAGVYENLSDDTTVLIASDHGNIEDVTAQHTRNPAFGFASGPGRSAFADCDSLVDIAPAALRLLGT